MNLDRHLRYLIKNLLWAVLQSQGLEPVFPGIVKDVIAQKGRALTCASKILQGLEFDI